MSTRSKTDWYYPTAFNSWDQEEHEAIAEVVSSGRFTMGEQVEAFESEFAEWHGMKHAIMVNSGSSANLIAISTLFHVAVVKWPATAIVPAMAWSTTYAPLVQWGVGMVIADVNNQWNVGRLDKCGLEPRNQSADFQIVCSILGNPAHFWGEAPFPIIEDNCESLGAVDLKGRKCGTRGLMNTFSLFWSHQLSAIEGGVILTNDDICAKTCRMLRAHGWTRDVGLAEPGRFDQEYDFRLFGYNVRPLELHAAVARVQLRKLPDMIEKRNKNVLHFRLLAMQVGLPLIWPIPNGEQSSFGIQFELEEADKRDHLVHELRKVGIDCRLPTGGSFTRHPYGEPWKDWKTPRADLVHDRGLFLGNAPFDLTSKIERAVRVMKKVLL